MSLPISGAFVKGIDVISDIVATRSRPARIAGLAAAVVAAGMLVAVPSAAVSGGTAVPDGSYRFAVKLNAGEDAGCSGALVDPQWVITAASCFAGNAGHNGAPAVATTATVGRTRLDHTDGHIVSVVDLLFRADRNVVLARLATPVTDVPPVAISTAAPTVGEALTVAGYGRTATEWVPNQLHSAAVSVQATADTTVAVAAPGTATTCKGDAGGPTIRDRNGTAELVAIHHTSWQNGCLDSTETRQGATETRLDTIADWVSQQVRGDAYTPLANQRRLLDTRTATGGHQKALSAGEIVAVPIPDLPAEASAVVVNLAGVGATVPTFLTAFGDTAPPTSNLNLLSGRAAAVMATVPVAADRVIRVRNNHGDVDVIMDLLGYYSASGNSTYVPRDTPQLALDTRTGLGGHLGPLQGGETAILPVRGVNGIPANATAVAVNVTATQPTGFTHVDVFAKDHTEASTLNVVPGEDRANQAVVAVGDDGAVRIFNHVGQTHLIVAVLGWFVPGDAGSRYTALRTGVRMTDTRDRHSPLTPGAVMTVPNFFIPRRAVAAELNITAITPTANTYLTVWAPGGTVPADAPALNATANDITDNSATTRVAPLGQVNIQNHVGTVDVVVDLQGYYAR
ncbi:S1 family peptidase [Actinocrispum wychmicini]|uniref:Trypsin n=1 Tax=Actinocrispum wychmicini TaxID=1213861 RepID=A0A4R2JXW5_9PSEU|nr:trypsin-like serine protease [Actinocrispum wychmicini]TCO62268.1 trypsin [Actinocrispum wychmicini]